MLTTVDPSGAKMSNCYLNISWYDRIHSHTITQTYINIIFSVFVDISSIDVGQHTAAGAGEENEEKILTAQERVYALHLSSRYLQLSPEDNTDQLHAEACSQSEIQP